MDSESPEPPKLARRSLNKHSTLRSGRTIAERREHLETASERLVASDRAKRHRRLRVVATVICFAVGLAALVFFAVNLFRSREHFETTNTVTVVNPYAPTVEVIDEDAAMTAGHVTARMREYIGMAEADFRELGLIPAKVVIPAGSIREVDFYLVDRPGYIKLTIDRDPAISAEDADRMLRYLSHQGVTDYQYIDVRIDGKAYWK